MAHNAMTFTREDGIKIQAEDLRRWRVVLKASMYRRLKTWATAGNARASWGDEVKRGDDLTQAVRSLRNGEVLGD